MRAARAGISAAIPWEWSWRFAGASPVGVFPARSSRSCSKRRSQCMLLKTRGFQLHLQSYPPNACLNGRVTTVQCYMSVCSNALVCSRMKTRGSGLSFELLVRRRASSSVFWGGLEFRGRRTLRAAAMRQMSSVTCAAAWHECDCRGSLYPTRWQGQAMMFSGRTRARGLSVGLARVPCTRADQVFLARVCASRTLLASVASF